MTGKIVTGLLITIIPVGLIFWDLITYLIWGNESTISKIEMNVSARHMMYALAFAFLAGEFIAHLFLLQTRPPE